MSMRPTTSVFGEVALSSATKFGSYSSVLTRVTLPVFSRSTIRGSLRVTKSPSLVGGPGGNTVAVGVGVAAGVAVSVGGGVFEAVAVAVAAPVAVGAASGLIGSVGSSVGDAPAVGVPVAAPVGDAAAIPRGVRVGVGVGPGARAPQPAAAAIAPRPARVCRKARRLRRRPELLGLCVVIDAIDRKRVYPKRGVPRWNPVS